MSMRDRFNDKNAMTVTGKVSGMGTSMRLATQGKIAKPDGRTAAVLREAGAITGGRRGKIGFLIDATGSRHNSWIEAQKSQRQMFEKVAGVGKMMLRLIHFGGDLPPTDHGWKQDSDDVARAMAEVTCVGGQTQLLTGLRNYLADGPGQQAQSIIMIGDSFEEDSGTAYQLAHALKARGIKVFACHEGADEAAASVFHEIATITGGKFFKLGEDIPLDEICENIALLTIGGPSTLKQLGRGKSAAQLLLLGASDAPKPGQP